MAAFGIPPRGKSEDEEERCATSSEGEPKPQEQFDEHCTRDEIERTLKRNKEPQKSM